MEVNTYLQKSEEDHPETIKSEDRLREQDALVLEVFTTDQSFRLNIPAEALLGEHEGILRFKRLTRREDPLIPYGAVITLEQIPHEFN